jgi:hypothetical protein
MEGTAVKNGTRKNTAAYIILTILGQLGKERQNNINKFKHIKGKIV